MLVAAFGGEGAKNTRRVTRISLAGILLALALIWFGATNRNGLWRYVSGRQLC